MKVRVNGETREVRATNLAALIAELDYGEALVATARNQTFVRGKDRVQTQIAEGDEIEILTPRQGG